MIINRRRALRLLGNAAVGGAWLASPPLRAATRSLARDANLPDTSTYETIRFPEREPNINYAEWYAHADEMTAQARKVLPHYLNLSYGTHVKQRLDLYLPAKTSPHPAPVMLFFHGGGFEEGHRAHYGYVAVPYAAQGIITAIVGYRLVPDGFHYPAQANDTKNSLSWVYKSIAQYGGNPNELYLSGHSVGATLSGEVGADRSWMRGAGIPPDALRGIAAISGNYDWVANPMDGQGSYYAPTRALQEKASAIRHIKDPAPGAVVTQGNTEEYERAWTKNSPEFVKALQAKGVDAELIVLPTGHLGSLADFSTPGTPSSEAILAMIEKHAV
jgi:acetyl esterase/lipase